MARLTALLVAESPEETAQLEVALRDGGFDVRREAPAEVVADPVTHLVPDVVLMSASLGLQRVALLAQRYARLPTPPTTLVFPQGNISALEACVRGGFDYVTPPYLPSLLRARMSSCWERRQLVTAVEDMAAEASLREYERDLSIAHEIQAGFLPERLPAPYGWDLAARFRPAKQVAGDFYDGFELVDGRRVGFVVADVCDKGVGAALFMALIRTLLRHTAEHTGTSSQLDGEFIPAGTGVLDAGGPTTPLLSVGAGPLVQAVVGTNRYLARNHLRQGYFATLFFGVLDPHSGAVLYINGGHNPAVLLRARGGHTMLRPTGPAVGMMPHSSYALGHFAMEPGDTLLLYTDGVVEARAMDGALFGTDRLLDVTCRAPAAGSADSLLQDVEDAVGEHVGMAEQSDDITMLALRRAAQLPAPTAPTGPAGSGIG